MSQCKVCKSTSFECGNCGESLGLDQVVISQKEYSLLMDIKERKEKLEDMITWLTEGNSIFAEQEYDNLMNEMWKKEEE